MSVYDQIMGKVSFIISIISCLVISGCKDDRLQLPQVHASPTRLDFTSEHWTGHITLTPYGSFSIPWTITYKPEWIDVDRTSGIAGDGATIVSADWSDLLPQTLTDKIVITTATGKIEIPVQLTVIATKVVEIDPGALFFDYNEDSRQITIKNSGNQSTPWQIVPSSPYLSVTPSSGSLNPDQSSVLTLEIDRSNLQTQTYSEKLTVKLEAVSTSETPVTINNFKEEKWLLDGLITDAEYDRVNDNMVLIVDNTLYKLSPQTRTMSSVLLPSIGTSVSVAKDGHFALVGHGTSISLVDISTMQVDKTYPTSAYATDVVLGPNNWAYVFPNGSNPTNIICINLADGTEVLSTGQKIYGSTKAKLHPSGEYIYGMRNALSPAYAEKYDIKSGQAKYLYESPYHAEHEYYQTWMSEDGSRMFARDGAVFNLSSDQSKDLVYDRTLAITNNLWVQSVDHNALTNRLCAVYFNYYIGLERGEVQVFSGDALTSLGIKPIPGFLIGQPGQFQLVPSEGVFGFFNSAGTKFYVCVKTRIFPPATDIRWAIVTINVE